MKPPISLLLTISFLLTVAGRVFASEPAVDYGVLPRTICSGPQGDNHVQGIAVDLDKKEVYYSFTTSLIKTDFNANLLGSVTGMVGQLGCISLNKNDRRLYASLEYKNDAIGKGILKRSGKGRRKNSTAFYIAVFDVDRIDRVGMDAERDGVMTTVHVKEATDDYNARVTVGGRRLKHRHGCSGIDGVTVAPAIGGEPGNDCLYVAYGIYGDTTRTDNDHQVILVYDVDKLNRFAKPLSQDRPHRSGPSRPRHKYFVYTGNTSWGIQNLAYDKFSGNFYAAVYCGKKSCFPNYSHFLIDGKSEPTVVMTADGVEIETLRLVEAGNSHSESGTWGWHFEHGSTGLCPIGGDYFYISHSHKDPETNRECSTVRLYRWTGDEKMPFSIVD